MRKRFAGSTAESWNSFTFHAWVARIRLADCCSDIPPEADQPLAEEEQSANDNLQRIVFAVYVDGSYHSNVESPERFSTFFVLNTYNSYQELKIGMDMNIVIIGYGKMGHEIESIALQRGHAIVGKFSSSSPLPPVSSDFYQSHNIHCCIDFSLASGVSKHAEICSLLSIPLVEGTTGWQHQQKDILNLVRRNNGSLIYGNNFSVGAQMFFNIVRRAAQLMNSFAEYDVAIHEIHHTQKKDAPSGTALTLSQILLSSMDRKNTVKNQSDNSVILPNEISISSTRIGHVSGTHSILFHSPADEIELIHRAHNRSGFASGAVLAAELTQRFPGIFSFEELIFEKSIHKQEST